MTLQQHQRFLEQRDLLEGVLVTDFETVQFHSSLLCKDCIAHLDDRFQHSGVKRILVTRSSLVLLGILGGSLCLTQRAVSERYLRRLAEARRDITALISYRA